MHFYKLCAKYFIHICFVKNSILDSWMYIRVRYIVRVIDIPKYTEAGLVPRWMNSDTWNFGV